MQPTGYNPANNSTVDVALSLSFHTEPVSPQMVPYSDYVIYLLFCYTAATVPPEEEAELEAAMKQKAIGSGPTP